MVASAEELALQETQALIAAEAKAAAEKQAKLEGDQSGAAQEATPPAQVAEAATPTASAVEEKTPPAAQSAEEKTAATAEGDEASHPDKAHDDPTAAIVALRKRSQALMADKLRLEGMVQALQNIAPKPETKAAPAQPAADPRTHLRDQRLALAAQADSGEITLVEMRQKDMELEDRIKEIEYQQLIAGMQQRQAPAHETDLSLEQATAKLAADYPVLETLSVADLAPFKDLAYAQAAREGNPIQPGALGTLELRTRMAKLATKMYGAEPAPAAQTQPKVEGTAVNHKADALAAKVEMQAGMPPNVAALGKANTEQGMSEAELTARLTDPNLTYEDSAKLLKTVSPALRQKLGI